MFRSVGMVIVGLAQGFFTCLLITPRPTYPYITPSGLMSIRPIKTEFLEGYPLIMSGKELSLHEDACDTLEVQSAEQQAAF